MGAGGSVTGWVHGGAWGWREKRGYKPNAGGDEIVQRSPGNVSLLILFKQNMKKKKKQLYCSGKSLSVMLFFYSKVSY